MVGTSADAWAQGPTSGCDRKHHRSADGAGISSVELRQAAL